MHNDLKNEMCSYTYGNGDAAAVAAGSADDDGGNTIYSIDTVLLCKIVYPPSDI